ncbi:DNA mismatch repair endonuclease MutL [soil metagenome]
MARIKQLSPHEAQKIAAGQVVERPANVVKELLENSLDAGATHISIYIEDAGKKLIRIVDNGYGMSQEDAHLCFKHHATSKITSVEQLSNLATFGFRGEALASIAAVSKITLTTKEADANLGTQLQLENLQPLKEEAITCNTGTDIQIADLFYNVPARKKFLKTNDTEWRQIQLLFQAVCLDYRNVHFSLHHQNALIYNCPPVTDLANRISQLYDHTIAAQLLAINHEVNGIQIEGVVSAHTYGRYDRSAIFFLVNKRWVKNHNLNKALLKGYANVLPPDKYPLACLHITLDPAQVDINIHPRKEEVQFLHPRIIEQAIQAAVKSALETNLSAQLQKKVHLAPEQRWQPQPTRSFSVDMPYMADNQFNAPQNAPVFVIEHEISNDPRTLEPFGPATIANAPYPDFEQLKEFEPQTQIPLDLSSCKDLIGFEIHIVGQLHKTYILIEERDGLFIVDQHAAHERILYEQFATRFEEVATIALLFPPVITLSEYQMGLLMAHQDIFVRNHIGIEQLGANQVMVNAIPVHLKEINMDELVHQTIGWIEENQKCDPDLFYKKVNEKLHAQMACKAAVKAGDILTQTQMHQLITDLQTVNNRFTCPHGRPTGWNISLYEIEKKFKRKL